MREKTLLCFYAARNSRASRNHLLVVLVVLVLVLKTSRETLPQIKLRPYPIKAEGNSLSREKAALTVFSSFGFLKVLVVPLVLSI